MLVTSSSIAGTTVCFYVSNINSVAVQFQGTPNVDLGGLSSGAVVAAINTMYPGLSGLITGQIQNLFNGPVASAVNSGLKSALNGQTAVMQGCKSILP